MINTYSIAIGLFALSLLSCTGNASSSTQETEKVAEGTNQSGENATLVYQSEDLIIRQISEHTYQHISFLNTTSFGKVPCNGMIVVDEGKAVILDSPAYNEVSQELILYLTTVLNLKIDAIVSTHFHADCLGGLDAFHQAGVASFATHKTIEFARNSKATVPQNGFDGNKTLPVGGKAIYLEFVGEGHTRDNIIGYFPNDSVLFGGCLIKEIGAGKGNLEDANTTAWSETVRKIKAKYPQTKIVIPGHGQTGGTELLDYTITLFELQ
jgi:metallo-beta-lactamase class B